MQIGCPTKKYRHSTLEYLRASLFLMKRLMESAEHYRQDMSTVSVKVTADD